jgi:polyhydroxyalkanoate synthesis regulator phasin
MSSSSFTASASSEAPVRPPRRGIFGIAHNLALASIGIAGVLGDEAGDLYRRSVERGGSTVQHVKERLPHPHRPHRRSAKKPAGKRCGRSHQASDAYEAALARLNVPTEADIDALTRQIAELEAKVDQLGP